MDSAWLRAKYLDEGLSTYAIARIVQRNPKNVYAKLREFGIPTRPRGLNLKGKDHAIAMGIRPTPVVFTSAVRAKIARANSGEKLALRGARNGMFGRRGPLSPTFVDGSTPERQRAYVSAEWRQVTRLVFARDRGTCRRCRCRPSGPRSLHAHHIKPWAGNPEQRFDPANLASLCRTCHLWVHSNANVNREWLE